MANLGNNIYYSVEFKFLPTYPNRKLQSPNIIAAKQPSKSIKPELVILLSHAL